MGLECRECEMDARAGHNKSCSRHPNNKCKYCKGNGCPHCKVRPSWPEGVPQPYTEDREVVDATVNTNLTERRSQFVYDGARLAAMAANAPIIPVPWNEREEDFKAQFRDLIDRQCSDQRLKSPEELHGSWCGAYFVLGWKYGPVYDMKNKIHPDLVAYEDLGQLERDKDAVFVALCEIARLWVYDLDEAAAS